VLKIDISNLARTEARFRNRVISTGKVLYSASKRLRAEDGPRLVLFKGLAQILETKDDRLTTTSFEDFTFNLFHLPQAGGKISQLHGQPIPVCTSYGEIRIVPL